MIVLESDFLLPSLVLLHAGALTRPPPFQKWNVLVRVLLTQQNGERYGERSRPQPTQREDLLVSQRDAFKETRGVQLSVWEESNTVREDGRV